MPIEHMKASFPDFGAVNSMIFSPRCSGLKIFNEGIVITLVHPKACVPSIFQRTGIPALMVRLRGSYPYDVTFIATSCTPSFTVGSKAVACRFALTNMRERSMPVSAKPLLRLKRAKMRTSAPEKCKKRRENVPLAVEETALKPTRDGSVPNAKTSMVIAPVRKLPDASATSCNDCVKPQGKKNVIAPSVKGARG